MKNLTSNTLALINKLSEDGYNWSLQIVNRFRITNLRNIGDAGDDISSKYKNALS